MHNSLSLLCVRLGTLAASAVESWAVPRGSVPRTSCPRGCGCTVPAGSIHPKVGGIICLTSEVFLLDKSAWD